MKGVIKARVAMHEVMWYTEKKVRARVPGFEMNSRKVWLTKKNKKRRAEITRIAAEGLRGSKKVRVTKKVV